MPVATRLCDEWQAPILRRAAVRRAPLCISLQGQCLSGRQAKASPLQVHNSTVRLDIAQLLPFSTSRRSTVRKKKKKHAPQKEGERVSRLKKQYINAFDSCRTPTAGYVHHPCHLLRSTIISRRQPASSSLASRGGHHAGKRPSSQPCRKLASTPGSVISPQGDLPAGHRRPRSHSMPPIAPQAVTKPVRSCSVTYTPGSASSMFPSTKSINGL